MNIYLKDSSGTVHQVLYPSDNLLKPTFTIRRKDEEGFKSFSFSGDLTFIDADYTFLYNELVSSATALENEVEIKFIDECCSAVSPFIFSIKAESLQWCENQCTLTAAAVEKSSEEEALRCLRNTMIWDDTPENWTDGISFKNRQHPRITYCNEIRPQWQHDFIMIAGILLATVSATLFPITIMLAISIVPLIKTVQFIVNTLNNIFGSGTVDLPDGLDQFFDRFDSIKEVLNEFKEFERRIFDNIVGCGRKHPSPLIRDYATNVCAKCGLQFSSSIFNSGSSDYFNAVYHNAPVDKGTEKNDFTTFWIENNKPILCGSDFFDQLKRTFNSEWTIQGNKLVFERKDFFAPQFPWLDVTQLQEDEYELCYNWTKKQRPAYGNFQYARDPINTVGSEANFRWGDIVEWNVPVKLGQKGEFKPLIDFAACRFRDDHVRMIDGPERDVLTFYENFALTPGVIANRIKDFKGVVLLNQHVCYSPMILIWDPSTSSTQDARVNPDQFIPNAGDPNLPLFQNNSKATPPGEYYNYPMWFDAQMPNNMYPNFWEIEDPRHAGFNQGVDYRLTVELTCVRLAQMDIFGMVQLPIGLGKIDEMIIDYPEKKLMIKGTV